MKKEFSFFPTQLADGHPISLEELASLHHQYEVGCTAEYLSENFPILSNKECLEFAQDVRRLMNKREMSESEAIDEIVLLNKYF
jgi:hypothetical protein